MSKSNNVEGVRLAGEIASFLEESGAREVVALDISAQSSIADAFVIATVASVAQMKGLHRRVYEQLAEGDRRPRHSAGKGEESGWLLMDCDDLVVHLMLEEQRSFYQLEDLWYDAAIVADFRRQKESSGD